jgi:hypothetical protein
VFGRATDEQVNVVGLNSQVLNVQAFLVGNFVEDGLHTVGNLSRQYRVAVLSGTLFRDIRRTVGSARLWEPHEVVVEVVGCVPCGLHPYYTLWSCHGKYFA